MSICDLQQLPGIASALPSSVDLQLYSEETGTLSIKDRRRLIVIILDRVFLRCAGVARITQGEFFVLIVSCVAGTVIGQQHTAAFAVCVITVIAELAEGRVAVSGIVIVPDPVSTAAAEDRFLFQSPGTDWGAVDFLVL